jgi:hypothetical protein
MPPTHSNQNNQNNQNNQTNQTNQLTQVFKNDIIHNGNYLDQSETIAPNYTLPDTKTKNHIIIINSGDRNWYNYPNESPYNYLVKLGSVPTDQFSTVSHDYKNIVSFSVEKIILPNRPCIQSYMSNVSPHLNDNPYLTVTIQGINFSSYGTNRILNETVGIYTPIIPIPNLLNDLSYLEYKNSSVQKKEYDPTPEGYISNLNLRINNTNGTLASNLHDIQDIYSIFLTPGTTLPLSILDTLTIQTSTYFSNIEVKQNDLICIKNYQYHNMSYDESGIFNKWINRDEGHYVININKSNPTTTLYDQIIIPIPAELSTSTGNIIVDTWFDNFVIKSLSNIAIQDNGGKLINVSMQSHLIVNIKTLEKNDNIFLKDII